MSKKRTLKGISADKQGTKKELDTSLPVTSMFLSGTNVQSNLGTAVKGVEYLVDPNDCKPWKYHNRDEVWMNADKCRELISSIRKNGQKFPVIARKLENDPDGKKWEIIAGRRRWFSCKHIGEKLRLKSTDANDRDCAILMNLENKDRDDVSEFEDAISYKQQLDANLFDSQDDMAAALDLNKSKLSKMLAVAKLMNHTTVMRLFDDITTLKINPVYKLVVEIEKNSNNKEVIYEKAKNLFKRMADSKVKMSSSMIITKLLDSLKASSKTSNYFKNYKIGGDLVIKAIESKSGVITFEMNRKSIDSFDKKELKDLLSKALEDLAKTPVS